MKLSVFCPTVNVFSIMALSEQFMKVVSLNTLIMFHRLDPSGVPHTVAKLSNGYNSLHLGYILISAKSSHFCHCSAYNQLLLQLASDTVIISKTATIVFAFGEYFHSRKIPAVWCIKCST